MSTRTRRTFSSEFKRNAVEMIINGGRRIQEVARELGIDGTLLSKWKSDYKKLADKSFPGKGHQTMEEEEIRKLRMELQRVKEERDILKKAVGFFSRDS
jgi:transposase